ncbi:c-type cytochrome [Arcobacter sp. LA11]|uniref:c-type cytochrome n=1 Tax=Arcobacter sp. LA11 TaxID=1898176 RepID=UPI0009F9C622|nr:c-type cytochrome [Arcobacter sp. LA11]
MKKIAAMLFCLCSLSYAVEYDPLQGQMLSLSCASCHGTDGKSIAVTPYIAGMGKNTMYSILLGYKNGQRKGTMMQKHVKGFSDAELEQISYYFSKIER